MPRRTVKMIVQYDGAGFHGFQKQKDGARTVQGELDRALSELLKCHVETVGASRTDAGVHAFGQTVSFDTDGPVPAEKIAPALRPFLPEDIAAASSEAAPEDFNARFAAKAKTYCYLCYRCGWTVPVFRNHAIELPRSFDPAPAAESVRRLEGTHDFSAFANQGSSPRDPVKTIYSFSLEDSPPFLKFVVTGTGFLYKQVRTMVGAAIEAGAGRMKPEQIDEALESGKRELGGPTAPPQGLYLMKVFYDNSATELQKTCFLS